MNLTLNGLENLLKENFSAKQKIHLIRYADDFVITGESKEILENEVKPLVENFLKERGLSSWQKVMRVTESYRVVFNQLLS